MNKLLTLCGPTATGKSSLAFWLAKEYGMEVLSADSRQIYKRMDIGTGKEYSNDKSVKVWGYDLVEPTENFSVAQFAKLAVHRIADCHSHRKLPLLVGGTGLYIKAIVDGIETLEIPQNKQFRTSVVNATSEELYSKLLEVNPERAQEMNNSDRNNPRRLIRALEIAAYKEAVSQRNLTQYDNLFIGLTAPLETLYQRVEKRAYERLTAGLIEEIKALLNLGVSWDAQSMSALGYCEWKDYFLGQKTKEQVISEWVHDEQQYVKRQLTWFRKDRRINWVDVSRTNWRQEVVKLVHNYATQN